MENDQILVIDDNPTNLQAITEYLEEDGFDVLVALDGEDGLQMARDNGPDLILLDMVMPGIDGFETCLRLRRDEATKDIPVIFLTALGSEEDRVKGFEVGGIDCVTKSIFRRELLARIIAHLTLQKQRLRLQQMANDLQETCPDLQIVHEMEEDLRELEEERKSRFYRLNANRDRYLSIRVYIKPEVEALIFDCDGTLADTVPLHIAAFQDVVSSNGGGVTSAFLRTCRGLSDRQVIERINEELGYQLDPVQAAYERERVFFEKCIVQVKPIVPIVDVARRYYGELPMAVATGGLRKFAVPILKIIGVSDLFETLVTVEEVPRGKPAPDLFLEAARRLNVPPERCHVFEDADSGLEAARRAGMTATDVRRILGIL